MSEMIDQKDLSKALSAMKDALSKGHNSGGTATTKVETMSGEGGSTQVYHTPSNSDPRSWAGSSATDVAQNGATDSIASNGTDYQAQARMMKSILTKIAKGQPLTATETAFYKGMAFGAKDEDKDEGDDKDADVKAKFTKISKAKDSDEDDDDCVAKSLLESAQDSEVLSKGFEVSTFLEEFASTFSKSLDNHTAQVKSAFQKSLAKEAQSTFEFQKSLAEAVVGLGTALQVVTARLDQVEASPARAPKSIVSAGAGMSKSLGGAGESLSKSQIGDILVDMVKSQKLPAAAVLEFDSTSRLSPELSKKVDEYLRSR